ncbi:GNAT family N-acetyltransferase [Jannaschia sp. LMIT008]|uniref:GNAT family N-acetyltransferase n=1 Tax=Jannaschia maritima TaxID=3032585 RepID=UPI002812883F|nr:GNAT family N-acetyltransferase [Jannaschia sp. LMIT008]
MAALSIEVWTGTYLRRGVAPMFARHVLDCYAPAAVAARLASDGDATVVAEAEEGPIGYVTVSSRNPGPIPACGAAEVTTLYLQPRHHGRGIGAVLLGRGLDILARDGADRAWLTTNAENAPAIGFYGRMGFRNVGRTDYLIDGVGYPNVILVRSGLSDDAAGSSP